MIPDPCPVLEDCQIDLDAYHEAHEAFDPVFLPTFDLETSALDETDARDPLAWTVELE